MDRQPIVAGQFYPGTPKALQAQVKGFLARAEGGTAPDQGRTLLAMAPHAGYVFSGQVAGITLGQAALAPTVLLLGPNHTGLGAPFALWDSGAWQLPGRSVPVHEPLAQALLQAEPLLEADTMAHEREHSLEVLLPFLVQLRPELFIVPMAVAEQSLPLLLRAARSIAAVLAAWPEPVSLVVSSDMSHYVPHELAKERDRQALERIEALDPEGLYAVVRERGITMCGILPMTLGLAVCRELGATSARVAAYATSGDASGDYSRVVGYAGALVTVPVG